MPLSKKQLQDVCLLYDGTHKKCRYLAQDDADWTRYYCLKKSGKKSEIDVETDEFIRDTRKKGKRPPQRKCPDGRQLRGVSDPEIR
jgi:hypothetical protein